MTGIEVFAFIVLPLAIAVTGGTIAFFYGRGGKDQHFHPGE